MHLLKSVYTSSPLNTIAEWNEARIFLPPQLPATAPAQNVLPRLTLIITAANTMALNSASCRLRCRHNPPHLAHSFTHRRTEDKTKWRRRHDGCGRGKNEGKSLSPLWYSMLLITVSLSFSLFFPPLSFICHSSLNVLNQINTWGYKNGEGIGGRNISR